MYFTPMRYFCFTLFLCIFLWSSIVHSAAPKFHSSDYYEILGLSGDRDEVKDRDIKTAWRRLSKKYHPDLKQNSADLERSKEIYQKVQRAYEVLGDVKKRKVYDLRGEEGVRAYEGGHQGGMQQQMDPFLSAFFGHAFRDPSAAKRGENQNMALLVSLEDMYNGAAHTVTLNKQKLCKTCKGTGARSKSDIVKCSRCKGTGRTTQVVQIMPGFNAQQSVPCSRCNGEGTVIAKKCSVCNANKVVRGKHVLGIDIERGTPENHELKFEMEGDEAPDEIPGDVIFTVRSVKHKFFQRVDNKDLRLKVNVTLNELLLGFTKQIQHLDGHVVMIEEPGLLSGSREGLRGGLHLGYGAMRCIEGEGMPIHQVPSERGSLCISYNIILPEKLTLAQRRAIEKVL